MKNAKLLPALIMAICMMIVFGACVKTEVNTPTGIIIKILANKKITIDHYGDPSTMIIGDDQSTIINFGVIDSFISLRRDIPDSAKYIWAHIKYKPNHLSSRRILSLDLFENHEPKIALELHVRNNDKVSWGPPQ